MFSLYTQRMFVYIQKIEEIKDKIKDRDRDVSNFYQFFISLKF